MLRWKNRVGLLECTVPSTAKDRVAELVAHLHASDRAGIERIYHSDYCLCLAKPFGQTERRHGARQLLELNETYRRAFPSFQINVETILEEGERVVVQWSLDAKPARRFVEPFTDIPVECAAERVRVEGIAFHRFRDGRLAESFLLQDDLGMLMQLGVDPGGLPVVDVQPGVRAPRPLAADGSETPLKRIMREFMAAVVNEKDDAKRDAAAVRFVHPGVRLYGPDAGNVDPELAGIQKFTAGHRKYRRAFPHFQFNTLEMVEEGNLVALRWAVADAWHTGSLQLGEHELRPTGNNANVHGAAICEFKGDKILSIWQLTDSASLLRQIMS